MDTVIRFNNHLIDNRQIRIFLSSTFSDMQDERNALIQTFELLKIEAAKRDVSLSVVDLRWGITDEEAKSGKVISVCLNEIENSHPFFIGILGSNYGTAPDRTELKKNPELIERYPWLDDAISDNKDESMSITEMEIQYGVLNNDNIDAAFFFKLCNQPDNHKRLTTLKETIRKKYDPNYQNDFTMPSELCEKVAIKVRKIINKHFPERNIVTPLDRERTAQRAYINSRHSYYFERQFYFDIIDSFVKSDKQHQHLVFTGESGIGKSALLANWIKENEKNSDFNLVYHFVGNSFSGNSYENILRHLCDEIYDLYSIRKKEYINEKIEDEAQRLITEIYTKQKLLVIVIDGINQIITRGDGKEKLLNWLPFANKNVKYIFSTLSNDETSNAFNRRNYRIEIVNPLTKEERKIWIPQYLSRVGKHLDKQKKQLERIINDTKCKNTLVLRTLLDELTCFGIHEELDKRIDYYLSAHSILDFFDRVLQRMEKDYSSQKNIVRHALTLIAVSEHGLSEDELLEILGLKQQPLEWHLFFCSFFNHFVVSNGLISFSHQYIKDVVNNRYCKCQNASELLSYRKEIIDCFVGQKEDGRLYDYREISELTYQYYKTNNHKSLYNILIKKDVFNTLFEAHEDTNLFSYWEYLTSLIKYGYSLSDYLDDDIISDTSLLLDTYHNISFFIIHYFNNRVLALRFGMKRLEIFEDLIKNDRSLSVTPLYAQLLNDIGINTTSSLEKANYLRKSIEIYILYYVFNQQESFLIDIADSYHNLAVCHYELLEQGDFTLFDSAKSEEREALRWLDKALCCFPNEELNILERKCISLNTYSNILALRGDSFTESLQRINEAEKIARYLLGNNKLSGATLAITLENKGLKLKKISSVGITEIENCYKEALNLYSQLAKLFPNKYIGNLADMYEKIAMLISDDSQREIEVFDLFEKSLKQYKQCLVYSDDYFIDIARIHNNIGWTYYKTAKNYTDLLEAKKHLMECLSIRRNLVQTGVLQEGALHKVLCNLYTVFQQLGMHVEAMQYYIEATRLKMRLNGYGRR